MSNLPSGYGQGNEYSEQDYLDAGGELACGCTSTAPCDSHGAPTRVAIRTASQNTAYIAQKLSHLEKGDSIGPPLERVHDEIDAVILGVIDALPAARRLFPDLYAWIVTDAVREHLAANRTHPHPERTAP